MNIKSIIQMVFNATLFLLMIAIPTFATVYGLAEVTGVDVKTISKAGIVTLMVTSPLLIGAFVKISGMLQKH